MGGSHHPGMQNIVLLRAVNYKANETNKNMFVLTTETMMMMMMMILFSGRVVTRQGRLQQLQV